MFFPLPGKQDEMSNNRGDNARGYKARMRVDKLLQDPNRQQTVSIRTGITFQAVTSYVILYSDFSLTEDNILGFFPLKESDSVCII